MARLFIILTLLTISILRRLMIMYRPRWIGATALILFYLKIYLEYLLIVIQGLLVRISIFGTYVKWHECRRCKFSWELVFDVMSESSDGRDDCVGVLAALQRTMSLVVDRYTYKYIVCI